MNPVALRLLLAPPCEEARTWDELLDSKSLRLAINYFEIVIGLAQLQWNRLSAHAQRAEALQNLDPRFVKQRQQAALRLSDFLALQTMQ